VVAAGVETVGVDIEGAEGEEDEEDEVECTKLPTETPKSELASDIEASHSMIPP